MTPEQLSVIVNGNVEQMRDALLGGFMVQTLKTEDPAEYESLLAYFMTRPDFCDALVRMNEKLFGEVAA